MVTVHCHGFPSFHGAETAPASSNFYFSKEKLWSFQQSWFSWLHYSETDDAAFCFICIKADKAGKLKSGTKDQAFIRRGFTNWKDGPESFRRHEESKCHKEAHEMIVTIPKTVGNFY